ncbi:MAG: cupredoxin domain-containing protein [Bauldia sp.]
MKSRIAAVAVLVTLGFAAPAFAEDPVQMAIVIKDHKFDPVELKVPAGKVVELTVDNQDPTPEEFESATLRVEKIIPGSSKGKVRFGPLSPDVYLFIGDFNQATARGAVTAE